MPRTGQPAFRLVGAVQRAFSVLDALAEADTELGTNEIARRQALVESTGETATLSAPGERDAVTVDFVQSPSSVQGVARLGRPSVGHATATGKVLLAFGHRALPPGQLKVYTARTITQRSALSAELEAIRERGYAYNFGEREDDLHAIAAPIWGNRAELAAIIGVQGPSSRFTEDAMEAAVRPLLEHTTGLSLELGWSGFVEEVLRT